ncbi:hypothetical protein BDF14DRAFT_1740462 [Spinellus fusiger]|nr:hypothetical protein BDF14DRAFT_1740462 [Spinellus fusiger]
MATKQPLPKPVTKSLGVRVSKIPTKSISTRTQSHTKAQAQAHAQTPVKAGTTPTLRRISAQRDLSADLSDNKHNRIPHKVGVPSKHTKPAKPSSPNMSSSTAGSILSNASSSSSSRMSTLTLPTTAPSSQHSPSHSHYHHHHHSPPQQQQQQQHKRTRSCQSGNECIPIYEKTMGELLRENPLIRKDLVGSYPHSGSKHSSPPLIPWKS